MFTCPTTTSHSRPAAGCGPLAAESVPLAGQSVALAAGHPLTGAMGG